MSWSLRAVEGTDGRWACRREWLEYGTHDNLTNAVARLRIMEGTLDAATLLVESQDGSVEQLGRESSDDGELPSSGSPEASSSSDTQCRIDAFMKRLRAKRSLAERAAATESRIDSSRSGGNGSS